MLRLSTLNITTKSHLFRLPSSLINLTTYSAHHNSVAISCDCTHTIQHNTYIIHFQYKGCISVSITTNFQIQTTIQEYSVTNLCNYNFGGKNLTTEASQLGTNIHILRECISWHIYQWWRMKICKTASSLKVFLLFIIIPYLDTLSSSVSTPSILLNIEDLKSS
jgi:hypothetical protein